MEHKVVQHPRKKTLQVFQENSKALRDDNEKGLKHKGRKDEERGENNTNTIDDTSTRRISLKALKNYKLDG